MSEIRKKAWRDLTNYLREQWTGFPPEIQEGGNRLSNRFGPIAGRYVQGYTKQGKEVAKNTIVEKLRRVPISTPYTGPKAFQPKPKVKKKPKGSWWDIVLSKKEQEEIKKIRNTPNYLFPKEDKEKK